VFRVLGYVLCVVSCVFYVAARIIKITLAMPFFGDFFSSRCD